MRLAASYFVWFGPSSSIVYSSFLTWGVSCVGGGGGGGGGPPPPADPADPELAVGWSVVGAGGSVGAVSMAVKKGSEFASAG